MSLHQIIRQKRKDLGLTQEQIAAYLNVSTAAVSKWENGLTSPDISLLAPLARLLKTDVNSLLCFTEDMSAEEISHFCEEISMLVQKKSYADGFQRETEKIHEYPHNETLLHCLALVLDSLLVLADLPEDEKRPYDEKITAWYRRLCESSDGKIHNSAEYMLANRLIRTGRYGEAQTILDRMPDKEDIIQSVADKTLLQSLLYEKQGQPEKAAENLQRMLLTALNKAQMILYKLVDAEIAAGNLQAAERIADKTAQMTPPARSSQPEFLRQILKSDLEREPCYDFLRGREDFQELL